MTLRRLTRIGTAALLTGAALAALVISIGSPNLVVNGSFEQGFTQGVGGAIPNGWNLFFCDTPYTPTKCPALRRDTQSPARPGNNEPNLMMGTPEWKDTTLPERTLTGHSSQMINPHRVGDSGISQTIPTVPGQVCFFTAHVMTWAAQGVRGTDGKLWTSDIATADDRAHSVWRLGVANGRNVYAFASSVKWGRKWTYEDGHYDHFAPITYNFVADSTETTIYIRHITLWPLPYNEGYVDNVSVQCADPITPTPGTSVPTPTQIPTQAVTPEACVMVVPACNPVRIITATPDR
jgi:hypothetical protein